MEAPVLTWGRLFFSFRGRIDRRTYIVWIPLPLMLILFGEFYGIGGLFSIVRGAPVERTGFSVSDILIGVSLLLTGVLFVWIIGAGLVKRLHDRGFGAFLAFVYLGSTLLIHDDSPIVLILKGLLGLVILVLVLGSSAKPNRHGEGPMRFHLAGGGLARSEPRPSGWGGFAFDLMLVLWPLVPVLVLRSLFFEPFSIPSGSNIPTLQVGDEMVVSKFGYGYSRYSLPLGYPSFVGRVFGRLPRLGDVAVFRLPRDPSVVYVKRVIGLPGDSVQVRQGQLYLNEKAVPRDQTVDYIDDEYGSPEQIRQFIETLPNGVRHAILQKGDNGLLDNTEVFHVPAGHVFMMGDNRSNSEDSRALSAVGYIPLENLIGPAEFRSLSIRQDGPAQPGSFAGHPSWEFWWWPAAIRYNRVFTLVR